MKSFADGESLRTPAPASAAITLWLAGSSVATALWAASLAGGATTIAAGAPTGLMLKSVLMAASWPPSSQIPTPQAKVMIGISQCCVRERPEDCADIARDFDERSINLRGPRAWSLVPIESEQGARFFVRRVSSREPVFTSLENA